MGWLGLRTSSSFNFGLSVFAAVAAAVVGVTDATATGGNIASVAVTEGSIEWRPQVDYERLLLRLSPPVGPVRQFEFDDGRTPMLVFDDIAVWPDGTFVWELIAVPRVDEDLRKELLAARERGDDETVARLVHAFPQPRVQSGSFRIAGGLGVPPSAVEEESRVNDGQPAAAGLKPLPAPDQQIGDDLIVTGSLCAGLSCVNGEDFGDDTLRLKQPVIRLKFEDSSVGANFPANDWQVTANDADSGGVDRFSIDDVTNATTPFTLRAGAPDHSIYADSAGRVGLGTATPATELHVVSADAPEVRLEQLAGGFPAQTWDVSANHSFFRVRDVTHSSKEPFRIAADAPTSSVEITGIGRVGIGTAAPAASLHVRRTDGTARMVVEEASTTLDNNRVIAEIINNGRAQIRLRNTADESGKSWFFSAESSGNFGISREGTGVLEVVVTPTGNMIITGNYTPDYVFDPDYELMPLSDLAEFVRRERHLPNVPDSAEVKAHGINLNDFPMRLLEKIEELTLYTIALERTVDDLQARLRAIEAEEPAASR